MSPPDPSTRPFNLGPLVARYTGRLVSGIDLLSLFLLAILGVLAPLGYGLWRANYAFTHFGPVAARFWARPWYALTLVGLAAFLLLSVYRLYVAHRFVAVHKNGLHLHLVPFRDKQLSWYEIAGVSFAVVQERFLGLTLRSRDCAAIFPNLGKPIRLDGLVVGLPEFVARLKASLYPRLLPNLSANFAAQQWLYFGPLAINCRTLRLPGKQLAWDQVRRLDVQAGYLVVELAGPDIPMQTLQNSHMHQAPVNSHRLPVSKIPNLELLLQIIQQGVNV